ncbi:hypothetical protein BDZ45DRAFT_329189 [Acephala macrosclerotiorum]|nr:hypothetical protein BDZ45DRAFT_329189 [Acephala macrosclerotiorum]
MSISPSDPLQVATNIVEIKPRRPSLIRRNARKSVPKYVDSTDFTGSDTPSLSPLHEGMPDYFSDIGFLARDQIQPDLHGRLYTDSVPLVKGNTTAERRQEFPTYGDGPTRNSKLEEILNRRAALVRDTLPRAPEKWALFDNKAGALEKQDSSQVTTFAQVYEEYLFYLDETSRIPP